MLAAVSVVSSVLVILTIPVSSVTQPPSDPLPSNPFAPVARTFKEPVVEVSGAEYEKLSLFAELMAFCAAVTASATVRSCW